MTLTSRVAFRLPIPVFGLSALALSCAKGDDGPGNVDGDWSLRSISDETETYQFPQKYTSEDEYMCTYTSGVTLHVDGDEAELTYYFFAEDCTDPDVEESYEYGYQGTIELVSGHWEISYEGDVMFVCALDGGDLRCEEEPGDVSCGGDTVGEPIGDTEGEADTDGVDTDGEEEGGEDTDGCEEVEEGPPVIWRWARI